MAGNKWDAYYLRQYRDSINEAGDVGFRPPYHYSEKLGKEFGERQALGRLGHAVSVGGNMSAGQRATHMVANTEQYLPSSVGNYFAKGGAFKQSAGKYIAEAFGWGISPGGPDGTDWARMGKSQGFLGSKVIAERGLAGALVPFSGFWGPALAGGASLYFTAKYAKEGWDESGITGAMGGVGKSIGEAVLLRKLIPKVIGTSWSKAKSGFGVGKGFAYNIGEKAVLSGRFQGGRLLATGAYAGAGIAGGLLGTAGAVVGAITNPWLIGLTGALYAYSEYQELMDKANRGNARLRQVSALEMGSPVVDQYGTIATLRQRSLAALQNSHVNGRMALGNEAALLH